VNRAERSYSQAAELSALLAWLDPDRERAGARYEQLRRKLILFFEVRQCQPRAEELADRTLDIVARRLQESVEIYAGEPSPYCYGVAHNVLRDYRKAVKLEPLTRDPVVAPPPPPEREQQLQCLERCLAELPAESRSLIQVYYQEEKRAKIDQRQQLARQLGLSANALRLRAYQIRRQLEASVQNHLDRPWRDFSTQIRRETKRSCDKPVPGDTRRPRSSRLGCAAHHRTGDPEHFRTQGFPTVSA
jgi:DNA-directed RNA polymerase specialized sigma24 family protein